MFCSQNFIVPDAISNCLPEGFESIHNYKIQASRLMKVLNRANNPKWDSVIFLFFTFGESGWLWVKHTHFKDPCLILDWMGTWSQCGTFPCSWRWHWGCVNVTAAAAPGRSTALLPCTPRHATRLSRSHVTFPCLDLPICRMGSIPPTSQGCCEDLEERC